MNTDTMDDRLTESEIKKVEKSMGKIEAKAITLSGEECKECDEEQVGYRVGKLLSRTKLCYNCGTLQSEKKSPRKSRGKTTLPSTPSKSTSGRSQEQASKDATKNFGKMLQMIGLMFSLTIIGAIVGIPLIIIGMNMELKEDDEDA